MIEQFPAEQVPDGAVVAPHHALIGIVGALFLCTLLWADRERLLRVPAVLCLGLVVSLFGWVYVWWYYPTTGAALFLGGLAAASGAFLVRSGWREFPVWFQAAMALSLVIAWDDAISHAFGVHTFFDHLWTFRVAPNLPVNR